MHSNLEVSILQSDAVERIVNVLATWWIDADHINASQIKPVGELLRRDGELFA
jgi:hypothetical protein